MTNKAIFYLTVDTVAQPTELTIKHVKYKTFKKDIVSPCVVEFESIINWDSHSFKISSSHPVTITGITFKLINTPMSDKPLFVLKQEIDKVDIFPERSIIIQNNNHLSKKGLLSLKEFKSMSIVQDSFAIVRFMTPRITLS